MESICRYYKSMEETQLFNVTISEGVLSCNCQRFHVVVHAIRKEPITFVC